MIRIAITAAAFDTITDTLPLGSIMYDTQATADGGRFIWPSAASTRCASRERVTAGSSSAWPRSRRRGSVESAGRDRAPNGLVGTERGSRASLRASRSTSPDRGGGIAAAADGVNRHARRDVQTANRASRLPFRMAAKPSKPKPASIITHVRGSGTAPASVVFTNPALVQLVS